MLYPQLIQNDNQGRVRPPLVFSDQDELETTINLWQYDQLPAFHLEMADTIALQEADQFG